MTCGSSGLSSGVGGRRRLSGEGTVYEESDPNRSTKYVAEKHVRLPNGRTRRVRVRAKTAREAMQKLRAREAALKRANPDAERLTVRAYLRDWLEHKRAQVKPSTLKKYRDTIEGHVIPHVGHLPLAKLSPMHAQRMITAVLNTTARPTGRRVEGPMHATANNARRFLKMALRDAERWGLLTQNPLRNVEPVRVPPPKRGLWEREQIHAFLTAAEGTQWHALFLTAIMTGMRRGELVALKWADITPTHISVRATESMGEIGTTKSRAGTRRIPLSPDLRAALEQHRAAWPAGEWVFGTSTGNRHNPRNINRAFNRYQARAGLPPIRFHDLRRIAATLWARRGFPPKLIQALLGHSTPHVALAVYQGVLDEQMREAHLSLDDLTGGKKGGNADAPK